MKTGCRQGVEAGGRPETTGVGRRYRGAAGRLGEIGRSDSASRHDGKGQQFILEGRSEPQKRV